MPIGACYQSNGESREMQRLVNSGIAVEITQGEFTAYVKSKRDCGKCKENKPKCKKCNENS